MAATRLIALHVNKGKTAAQSLADRVEYAINPEKTEEQKWVRAYGCDEKTCVEEFLLTRRQYEHITGRTQASDVIAYQIRQSFKPGEVTPEEANAIGYDLAMRFTKGKHAFVVATHTDKPHIHNHILFCAAAMDGERKFRDFHLSGLALANLSDMICLENQLSVIERKPYSEREKRTEYPKRTSHRDAICAAIDAAMLRSPKSMAELIGFLQEAGYEYKHGKQPALRGADQKRFIRFRSLGEGYSVDELSAVIDGSVAHKSKFTEKNKAKGKRNAQPHKKPGLSFLIDIQEKMQAGKGGGYARWAKVFNLKQMAQAMLFMEKKGIGSYAELAKKASEVTTRCDELLESVKADEAKLQEIVVLKKHIVNYVKSKEVFAEYKASGYSEKFFEEHREQMTLRRAAKQAFNVYKEKHGKEKTIPHVKELNAEYAAVLERKKKSYAEYRKIKTEMQDWLVAEKIVQTILGDEEKIQEAQERAVQENTARREEDR